LGVGEDHTTGVVNLRPTRSYVRWGR
jgi:hypothetical protein